MRNQRASCNLAVSSGRCFCFHIFLSHTLIAKEHETSPGFTLSPSPWHSRAVPMASSLLRLTAGDREWSHQDRQLSPEVLAWTSSRIGSRFPAASFLNLKPREGENKRVPCLPSVGEQSCLSGWGSPLRQARRDVEIYTSFLNLPQKVHITTKPSAAPFLEPQREDSHPPHRDL